MPPSLPAPTATFSVVTPASSTLPAGTYFAEVTQRNPWGETLPSTESSVLSVSSGQGIQVTSALLPSCTAIRVYLTLANGASGTEIQFVESATSPFTVVATPTGAGSPPSRSTAWLLDSDGAQFGASTVYQWMNEGMNKFMRAAGGMLDYSGVPTVAGQSMYVAPGQWGSITDVWYGGYWVKPLQRNEFFRRNTVTSAILSGVTVSVFSDKQVIEVNYQPDRTAGVTNTTADMSATDNSVTIANTGAFLLPFGFLQIGTEICAYASLASGAASGLIRGLGSTVSQAWPSGTVVTELSLFWCGKRLSVLPYGPGDSMKNLAAPQGWVAILPNYMLAQAKKAELDLEAAAGLEKTFESEIERWMVANRPVTMNVQVGNRGLNQGTLTFDNVLGNGVVVP